MIALHKRYVNSMCVHMRIFAENKRDEAEISARSSLEKKYLQKNLNSPAAHRKTFFHCAERPNTAQDKFIQFNGLVMVI